MEIKRMQGRYVRIAPEYITRETVEYVDDEFYTAYTRYEDTTDEKWERFCNEKGGLPYKEQHVYVNRNGACFTEPYEVFMVQHEFYGINMFTEMSHPTYTLREGDLTANCKHQLVINSTDKNRGLYPIWSAEYFEVVKKVEEITTEHLPNGVTKEIKTISWVRDEEFYK